MYIVSSQNGATIRVDTVRGYHTLDEAVAAAEIDVEEGASTLSVWECNRIMKIIPVPSETEDYQKVQQVRDEVKRLVDGWPD